MIVAIHFEGHPYDDDYDTHYGYTRDLSSIEAAKAEAFESLTADYAVVIYTEEVLPGKPDKLTELSRWSPKKQAWIDRPRNIELAFGEKYDRKRN